MFIIRSLSEDLGLVWFFFAASLFAAGTTACTIFIRAKDPNWTMDVLEYPGGFLHVDHFHSNKPRVAVVLGHARSIVGELLGISNYYRVNDTPQVTNIIQQPFSHIVVNYTRTQSGSQVP